MEWEDLGDFLMNKVVEVNYILKRFFWNKIFEINNIWERFICGS